MNKVKFILFTAGIVLAMAFTFSCSSDDGEEGGGGGGTGTIVVENRSGAVANISISAGNETVASRNNLSNGSSATFSDVPAGSVSVTVTIPMSDGGWHQLSKSVVLEKGKTIALTRTQYSLL